jgi:RNA polymerase sigma-70 factor, ECF subfamily
MVTSTAARWLRRRSRAPRRSCSRGQHGGRRAEGDILGNVDNFAYSVPDHVAEELTATTFERVVRHWGRYDQRLSSQRTWIMAIARNVLIDHFRRSRYRVGLSLDEVPALLERLAATEDPADRYASVDLLKHWLGRLSAREREVLALRYGADLPTAEIARALDLSEANVLQISSRALRRLRRALESSEIAGSERISDSA